MPCKEVLRRFAWGPELSDVLTSYVLCYVSEQGFWNIVQKCNMYHTSLALFGKYLFLKSNL